MSGVRLICGDCLDVLPTLASGSVDAVITDPPYPEIDRSYGRWTEAEWFTMMRVVVPECMRVLKPTGSAVFILQPNSERVGRMRTWLWEFMVWVGKEWGIVQDVWWWNHGAMPTEMANHQGGLRSSLKACVWLGAPDCYREQSAVLMEPAEGTKKHAQFNRHDLIPRLGTPKSFRRDGLLSAWKKKGGVTPHNVIVCAGGGGANLNVGHGAGTPLALCSWWTRYLCPSGGVILDPFSGTATVGLAAQQRDCGYVGIERDPEYHVIAQRRLANHASAAPLFDAPYEVDG